MATAYKSVGQVDLFANGALQSGDNWYGPPYCTKVDDTTIFGIIVASNTVNGTWSTFYNLFTAQIGYDTIDVVATTRQHVRPKDHTLDGCARMGNGRMLILEMDYPTFDEATSTGELALFESTGHGEMRLVASAEIFGYGDHSAEATYIFATGIPDLAVLTAWSRAEDGKNEWWLVDTSGDTVSITGPVLHAKVPGSGTVPAHMYDDTGRLIVVGGNGDQGYYTVTPGSLTQDFFYGQLDYFGYKLQTVGGTAGTRGRQWGFLQDYLDDHTSGNVGSDQLFSRLQPVSGGISSVIDVYALPQAEVTRGDDYYNFSGSFTSTQYVNSNVVDIDGFGGPGIVFRRKEGSGQRIAMIYGLAADGLATSPYSIISDETAVSANGGFVDAVEIGNGGVAFTYSWPPTGSLHVGAFVQDFPPMDLGGSLKSVEPYFSRGRSA